MGQILDQFRLDVRGSDRLWRKRRTVAAAVLLTIALAAAASFMVVVGLIGCGLPALQASRIDAARALRDE